MLTSRASQLVLILTGVVLFSACEGDTHQETGSCCQETYYALSEDGIAALNSKALKGDGEAAFYLSRHYLFVKKDSAQSTQWLKMSAEEGYPEGMYSYGLLLSHSSNTYDLSNARYWLQKAKLSDDLNVPTLADSKLREMDGQGR
jgi:TPR repeat protein